jgi:hypothetical protein
LTTNAILDRTDSVTGTDRLAELFDSHQNRLFHLALRLCSDRAPEPVVIAQAETPSTQIQFSTPGGTRVIWVLRPGR